MYTRIFQKVSFRHWFGRTRTITKDVSGSPNKTTITHRGALFDFHNAQLTKYLIKQIYAFQKASSHSPS